MVIDDSKPNPSAVRNQLREMEDFNMALRLQDEEYGHHYDQNRTERRTVGSDTKHSKVVQQTEDETARTIRRQAFRQIEETDEQIAQRLAAEWNAEESRKAEEKLRQELIDEEYARRLTESGEFSASSSVQNPDVMSDSTSSYQNVLSGSSSASFHQAQVPPYQPPSYDFAVKEQSQQDLLIDFSSLPSNVPPAPIIYPLSNQLSTPRGVPLPGLATSTVLPPSHLPQSASASVVSQPSIDSPIAWPAPPPSVLAPTNPFLADLTDTNSFSVAPPSAVPSSIGFVNPPSVGFHSEFGLPPPSSLALGQPRQPQ